jgi:hypothetical protein
MRRHIPGLREAAAGHKQEMPDGFFLVRVERAAYRGSKTKPYLSLNLAVLEPSQFAGQSVSARLYCTAKALWKLNWFLRDFGYDTDLLVEDQIDEKLMVGLRGVIKITHTTFNGRTYLNLNGFAAAAAWGNFPLEKAG